MAVSELSWQFVRHANGADIYFLTRKYPLDTVGVRTETIEVHYRGVELTAFEDDVQRVILRTQSTDIAKHVSSDSKAVMVSGRPLCNMKRRLVTITALLSRRIPKSFGQGGLSHPEQTGVHRSRAAITRESLRLGGLPATRNATAGGSCLGGVRELP